MDEKVEHPERAPQIRIRCGGGTLTRWKNALYDAKKKGLDAENVFLSMLDAYAAQEAQQSSARVI